MPPRSKIPITRRQPVATEKVTFAKTLRRNMTAEERLLWSRLRRSAVGGIHFHRQQVIGGFIVDFYCAAANLAIELDGPIHDGQLELDHERDQALAQMGIGTLRIRNEELAEDFEATLSKIAAACRRPNP
jgi:very-short-patch-repair endonuclease